MTRQLGLKSGIRDAMVVLNKDNLKHGSFPLPTMPIAVPFTLTTSTLIPAAGSLTTLSPGLMKLSTFLGNKSDHNKYTRYLVYGHWSSACPTPHNWKQGDTIACHLGGNSSTRNSKKLGGKDKPWTRVRGQVYNTKTDSDVEVDRYNEHIRESEVEEEDLEEDVGKA